MAIRSARGHVSVERQRALRRAIRTRDDFLSAVAMQLERRVRALSSAPTHAARAKGIEALRGFARELAIIASPRAPVPKRLRSCELTTSLTRTLTRAAIAGFGFEIEKTRGGAIFGRWDEELLASIVLELVSNAMKYGRDRPVTIRVDLRGENVRIHVINAGTWRGPSLRIERFRREETRRGMRGYGIGLWLSSRLARALGGRLSFSSREGETHAIVVLPFERSHGDIDRFGIRLTSP